MSRDIEVPEDAFSLQPVRYINEDELRYYTATTFPSNPRGGCQVWLSRCRIAGGIVETLAEAAGICDILNRDGDIIADVYLNRKGLNFMYTKLNCRVVYEEE